MTGPRVVTGPPPCVHVGVILLRLVGDRYRCLACGAEVHAADDAPVRGGDGAGDGNVSGEARPSTTGPRGA